MKTQEFETLQKMTGADLKRTRNESRDELLGFAMRDASKSTGTHKEKSKLKKKIAQIETILRMKNIRDENV